MSKDSPKVVIAPAHEMIRIKEVLDKNGNVVTRQVIEPKIKKPAK